MTWLFFLNLATILDLPSLICPVRLEAAALGCPDVVTDSKPPNPKDLEVLW